MTSEEVGSYRKVNRASFLKVLIISDNLHPGIMVLLGFLGFIFLFKVSKELQRNFKVGVAECSVRHLYWWSIYQLAAVFYQFYFYAILWDIARELPDFQRSWEHLLILTFCHIFSDVFFLIPIAKLLIRSSRQQCDATNNCSKVNYPENHCELDQKVLIPT